MALIAASTPTKRVMSTTGSLQGENQRGPGEANCGTEGPEGAGPTGGKSRFPMVRRRMTVNAFWLGATDTEAGIVSTVAGATETSSREEGAHSSSGKGEARSAGSGAALGWEAPCCPY